MDRPNWPVMDAHRGWLGREALATAVVLGRPGWSAEHRERAELDGAPIEVQLRRAS